LIAKVMNNLISTATRRTVDHCDRIVVSKLPI
jgi:hypothetical protein